MKRNQTKTALPAIFILFCLFSSTFVGAQTRSKFVSVKGRQFIAPDGKPIFLKGINLGNWLLPEGYMFEFKKTSSPQQIYTAFNQLLGEAEARRFWKSFQAE